MALDGLIASLLLIFLAMAFLLFFKSNRIRKENGLPDGKIIYSDTGIWHANEKPLHSADLRLIGKPDYLVEGDDGEIIPVEIKSGKAPSRPWEGHVLQLAAYCFLVEENYGCRPAYGILKYKDRAFAIDYSTELETDLRNTIQEMRNGYHQREINRDHDDLRRCVCCGFKDSCRQSLD